MKRCRSIAGVRPGEKSPRSRLRISLRTFLILLTLVLVWFGWLVERTNRQRKAVAWVRQMGGSVEYDSQYDNERYVEGAEPSGPEWLRDYHDQVRAVHFGDVRIHDLTPLTSIRGLKRVVFVDTEITDLNALANIKSLELLSLHNTRVTDLTPLRNLRLQSIGFVGTIGDLTVLTNMKSLLWLYLYNTEVDDLEPISNLTNLELIMLENTPVRDLTPLAGLKKLEWIDITEAPIHDVSPVMDLPNLQHLHLYGTKVNSDLAVKIRETVPDVVIYP